VNASDVAAIAVVAIAPLAIVMIFAMIRGYTITVHFTRAGKHRRPNDED
jgi:hypothetical protein